MNANQTFKLLCRSMLGASAMAVCVASATLAAPPRDTTTPDRRERMPADRTPAGRAGSEADAMRAAEALRRNNFTLAKAIEAAERHAKGQAIDARFRGAGGDGVAFDVTVLDGSGRLQVVAVDGATGQVTGMHAFRDGSHGHMAHAAKIKRATEVVGRDVVDASGQEIGEIDELAIDVGRGRIAYAIVELTTGANRLIAVPWSSLEHRGDQCVLNLGTDRRIVEAPELRRDRWPDMTSDDFGRRTSEFYGARPYGHDMAVPAGRTFAIVKSSDIIGGDVRSTADENLGDIEDLALDMNSSRVAYAVVAFGGFLGFGEKLFAIPMEEFTRDSDGNWVLAVSKERLREAPGFDKRNWPNMADPAFETQISDFYRPSGRERAPGATDPRQPPTRPQR